ncbi:MAG: hypothetical protein U0414_13520 [Polyangiaceae bacterium]
MITRLIAIAGLVGFVGACGDSGGGASSASASAPPTNKPAPRSEGSSTAAATTSAPASASPAPTVQGNPPADGKYERVTVEGVTVPMIQVMEKGTVVLVDTDGKKPRTWEEQYKRKRDIGAGTFDIHKTDVNKNDKFDDDPIDKEGLWVIDEKGNITKH